MEAPRAPRKRVVSGRQSALKLAFWLVRRLVFSVIFITRLATSIDVLRDAGGGRAAAVDALTNGLPPVPFVVGLGRPPRLGRRL